MGRQPSLRLTLLGVGAMRSPRYSPARLLLECRGYRVAIDGGPGAEAGGRLDAWLVTDERTWPRWTWPVRRAPQGVKRLVFAHIGRPSIRARDAGECPPFGEWGDDGRACLLRARAP